MIPRRIVELFYYLSGVHRYIAKTVIGRCIDLKIIVPIWKVDEPMYFFKISTTMLPGVNTF